MKASAINSTVNAIHSLLLDFDLYDEDGNAEFLADIDFIIKGRRKVGESNVSIKFHDSSHGIIKLFNKNSRINNFTFELDMNEQIFNYVENICLKISGGEEQNENGKYQLAIFPK